MKLTVEEIHQNGMVGEIGIRLNGLVTKRCIMADEEKGAVEVYRYDLCNEGMDHCPTEMLYGKVQILLGDAV